MPDVKAIKNLAPLNNHITVREDFGNGKWTFSRAVQFSLNVAIDDKNFITNPIIMVDARGIFTSVILVD